MKYLNGKGNSLLKFIIGLFVVVYVIFSGDLVSNVSKGYKDIKKDLPNIKESDNITDKISVDFINVGQGDAILIKSDNKYVLIDTGTVDSKDNLISYLDEKEIKEFEMVFLTHPDLDHIGGMEYILDKYNVNNIYMTSIPSSTKSYTNMLNKMVSNNIKYNVLKVDDEIKLNDAVFKVLNIDNNENNTNDSSICLKLIYKNNSFLFMADASSVVENKIMEKNIKSDVIKIAHHGSKESTSDKFIKKVNPTYAVISVGKNNIYNHPDQAVLNTLNNNMVRVFRTDLDNNILFESDGNKISLSLK